MRVLDSAIFIEANKANFNQVTRLKSSIKYVVVHYTGNVNDTARNNALYFRDAPIKSSAHFFVSEDTVYQSVPINHAAYAVGLGSMKEPYFKWPTMWNRINNSNSVSVEICGSKNSAEGTDLTKNTAAQLVADLLTLLDLKPSNVYRHYDVTGKKCPLWAVDDQMKWLDFLLMVNNYFYGEEEDDLLDNKANYEIFKTWLRRYFDEVAKTPADWEENAMTYADGAGLMTGGRPKSYVTRGELATVLMRMNGQTGIH